MGNIPLVQELALIAGIGAIAAVLLAKLRLPTVAGLLAAGAILGPFGLGLVKRLDPIEALAEVGVVFLLFTIGLEFSLERFRHIFRQVAQGGIIQVVSTLAATAGVALLCGEPPKRAVFYGMVLALSSTAIVLRGLSERSELDAPHGRFIVGTLILQDLFVIPMMLLIPVLGGKSSADFSVEGIAFALGKSIIVVAGAFSVARFVVPRLFRAVDTTRSREVFLLAVLAVCVGTAWVTSLAGLSLALGAFLGGMVVSDTEFQHRAMGDIIPLRDAFVSIFFVSLGMLFDGRLLVDRFLEVALLLSGFSVGKAALAILAAVAMRFPARAAWLAGIGLAQFGEFGFVLIREGEAAKLTDHQTASTLLAAGILSMFLAPVLIRFAPHLTAGERILGPLTRLLGVHSIDEAETSDPLTEHVVVIGYGLAGRRVVGALAASGVPHIALEMNAETVRKAREAGEPVYYADATSVEALNHASVQKAKAVVVLINDPQAAFRVVDGIRRATPTVPIIVRARYFGDRAKLMDQGASDVVVEEVEATVAVIGHLFQRLGLPPELAGEARTRDVPP